MRLTYALFALALVAAAPAWGEDVLRENLDAVKLPHGELLLPLPGAKEADKGMVLTTADGTFSPLPPVEPGQNGRDMLAHMQTLKTGDVLCPAAKTLIVVSTKAKDLGAAYLADVAAGDIKAPPRIIANPNSNASLAGTLADVTEGHVIVMGTVDGRYTLLRVLRLQPNGMLVQFVNQPDGTLKFDIPKGAVEPIAPDAHPAPMETLTAEQVAALTAQRAGANVPPLPGAPAGMAPGPVTPTPVTPVPVAPVPTAAQGIPSAAVIAPGAPAVASAGRGAAPPSHSSVTLQGVTPGPVILEPYFSTHMAQRERLIAHRVEIIVAPARTDSEIASKADAMDELGQLEATEAVDSLIKEISFYNTQSHARPFSMESFHPAVAALKKIGKPASLAAIKAIGELPVDDVSKVEDPLRTTGYKLRLLALVIAGVEGPEVGEYMLSRAQAQADTAHREFYDQAIRYVRQP